jgi:GGDEF domain-containing protein
MISLMRYINSDREEGALRQVISLLITKIGSSAVRSDLPEFGAFTSEIEGIGNRLDADPEPGSLLVLAETATLALTSYNAMIGSLLISQRNEMQHILGMLRDTLVDIIGETSRAGKRLQTITVDLERSGPITDLRVLKGQLTECLTGLKEEILQQKAQAAITVKKLQVTIERGGTVAAAGKGANPLDPITGLPDRDDAVAAMQTAIDGGKRQYAAVMIVNRVEMINTRFGSKVGDSMLIGFKEHMTEQLTGSDQLFRWTGPALVAILERSEPIETVRRMVRRLLDARIDVSYSADGRSALIPVSAVWSVIPLVSAADAEKRIQAFISAQSNQE